MGHNEMQARIVELEALVKALSERVHAQSELLARRAETIPGVSLCKRCGRSLSCLCPETVS